MTKTVCIAAKLKKEYAPLITDILKNYRVLWLEDMDPASRLNALKNADAVLAALLTMEFSDEEKKVLASAGMVQTMSAGVDQIDFGEVTEKINLYSNVGGWAHAMAEHALAMALGCTRMLRPQTEALQKGVFKITGYPMRLLGQCTVLIVGWGGIGKAAAKLFAPFGCRLLALGRTAPCDSRLARGYARSELKEALAQTDIVLLSIPHSNLTHHMIDAEALSAMKEDAILVNVARAELIDHDALYSHLQSHPKFFAALDVWWQERRHYPAEGDPLIWLPNVIGSAHNSYVSPTARAEAVTNALNNVVAYLEGRLTKGRVKIDEYRKKEG